MTIDGANSRIGIGTYTPGSTLDVNGTTILRQTLSVGGLAYLNNGLYVLKTSSADSNGVEFRHSNESQGIGFGFNTIMQLVVIQIKN